MVGATPAPTFQMMILMQKNWTRPTAAMQLVHQQLQAHLFRSKWSIDKHTTCTVLDEKRKIRFWSSLFHLSQTNVLAGDKMWELAAIQAHFTTPNVKQNIANCRLFHVPVIAHCSTNVSTFSIPSHLALKRKDCTRPWQTIHMALFMCIYNFFSSWQVQCTNLKNKYPPHPVNMIHRGGVFNLHNSHCKTLQRCKLRVTTLRFPWSSHPTNMPVSLHMGHVDQNNTHC
ncbi:uncharacterized protein LOC124693279 [Lolium rigidum]|uniref:uncharacterized protein LOC124693279 n=1 Tax=Lolium rigidum TaxID=89674 RepID=UPI001F5CB802|nr:uncharacterized protein LOC124693279 [Lolium rigidum]